RGGGPPNQNVRGVWRRFAVDRLIKREAGEQSGALPLWLVEPSVDRRDVGHGRHANGGCTVACVVHLSRCGGRKLEAEKRDHSVVGVRRIKSSAGEVRHVRITTASERHPRSRIRLWRAMLLHRTAIPENLYER